MGAIERILPHGARSHRDARSQGLFLLHEPTQSRSDEPQLLFVLTEQLEVLLHGPIVDAGPVVEVSQIWAKCARLTSDFTRALQELDRPLELPYIQKRLIDDAIRA